MSPVVKSFATVTHRFKARLFAFDPQGSRLLSGKRAIPLRNRDRPLLMENYKPYFV